MIPNIFPIFYVANLPLTQHNFFILSFLSAWTVGSTQQTAVCILILPVEDRVEKYLLTCYFLRVLTPKFLVWVSFQNIQYVLFEVLVFFNRG